MGKKDVSALNGTLNAPPAYGGSGAPVEAEFGATPTVATKAVNAKSVSTTAEASASAKAAVKFAAAIVVGSLVLLWVFGGIVFKNANL